MAQFEVIQRSEIPNVPGQAPNSVARAEFDGYITGAMKRKDRSGKIEPDTEAGETARSCRLLLAHAAKRANVEIDARIDEGVVFFTVAAPVVNPETVPELATV